MLTTHRDPRKELPAPAVIGPTQNEQQREPGPITKWPKHFNRLVPKSTTESVRDCLLFLIP